MREFRITIAGLMTIVVYLGVTMAVILNPTQLWSEVWVTAWLAVLAYAIIGAASSADPGRQTFWKGFAIAGGCLTALTFIPANPPRLVTNSLAEWQYSSLSYDPPSSAKVAWIQIDQGNIQVQLSPPGSGDLAGLYMVSSRMPGDRNSISGLFPSSSLRAISLEDYQRLWDAVLVIPMAALGGLVARRFAARRVETENEIRRI